MLSLLHDELFRVYVGLLGITALSWFASHSAILEGANLGAALLVLAFVKARLIIVHFMEAAAVHIVIRLAFEGWVIVAAATTIGLLLR